MIKNLKGREILAGRSFALLGGALNVLSGNLSSTLRAIGGALSITGNLSGWFSEKIFLKKDAQSKVNVETKLERLKTWAAGHQLLITSSQKTAGAVCICVSGIVTDNPAEMIGGGIFTVANALESKGEKSRAAWLTSTTLASGGAIAWICSGDPVQKAAGVSYLLASVSLALAKPEKYKSFRDRVEDEQDTTPEGSEIEVLTDSKGESRKPREDTLDNSKQ